MLCQRVRAQGPVVGHRTAVLTSVHCRVVGGCTREEQEGPERRVLCGSLLPSCGIPALLSFFLPGTGLKAGSPPVSLVLLVKTVKTGKTALLLLLVKTGKTALLLPG